MKKTTKDDYYQSVYKVIDYVENNYADELGLDDMAKLSGFSKYHFHRIFLSIMGENLNAFIRKVRLSKSTGKLASGLSVTKAAMQSGYETPASFAKAFKERFGLSPKEFSMSFRSQENERTIQPKIIDFDSVEVLYVRKKGDYIVSFFEAWKSLMSFSYKQKIKYKKNLMGKNAQMFGIGHDCPDITPTKELRYDACISYDDKTVIPEKEVRVKSIEGGKYLFYLHRGAYEGLLGVYNDLMGYIIEHELTIAERPAFEKYLNRDPKHTKPINLKTEIYIPIEDVK